MTECVFFSKLSVDSMFHTQCCYFLIKSCPELWSNFLFKAYFGSTRSRSDLISASLSPFYVIFSSISKRRTFLLSSSGRPRGFKLRLPLLRSLSNSKVSLDDAESGQIPTATPLPLHPVGHCQEALGLGEFLPLPPLLSDHSEQVSDSR